MSDPVDTDALRDEATWMQETLGPWLKRHGMIANSGDVQLIAAGHIIAADELDRLRESRDTWKRLANDERGITDRLRAVIEKAPHAADCRAQFHGGDRYGNGGDSRYCICWKAETL